MNYNDKVFLITGGTSGIGLELAVQLLERAAMVVITGKRKGKIDLAKNELKKHGTKFHVISANVQCYEDCQKTVNEIIDVFGRIDVLINNAAVAAFSKVQETQPNVVDIVVDTNIKGVYFMTQCCLPFLELSQGSVLFVSSIASFYGLPGYSLYSMTKKTLDALAESLIAETKGKRISISVAHLSFTQNDDKKTALDAFGNEIPVPKRHTKLVFTRKETATMLLRQISTRKFYMKQGLTGKAFWLLSHFKGLMRLVIR
jgi:NAD(P)-dependent dehydrogenase (short-subunit alcohol dehydrogenase family)